jgi:hypothetical protein
MNALGRVLFESATGHVTVVTPQLLEQFSGTDVAEWTRNSGTSSFTREDDGATLIVMRHHNGDFHLERRDSPADDYAVACLGADETLVTLVAGGDRFGVPARALLPARLALQVIRDFCEGEASRAVDWVDFSDLV